MLEGMQGLALKGPLWWVVSISGSADTEVTSRPSRFPPSLPRRKVALSPFIQIILSRSYLNDSKLKSYREQEVKSFSSTFPEATCATNSKHQSC